MFETFKSFNGNFKSLMEDCLRLYKKNKQQQQPK